jgi:hypothetical protein
MPRSKNQSGFNQNRSSSGAALLGGLTDQRLSSVTAKVERGCTPQILAALWAGDCMSGAGLHETQDRGDFRG